ncbi:MAG: hypothetical protein R3Y29_04580 [bacterium]
MKNKNTHTNIQKIIKFKKNKNKMPVSMHFYYRLFEIFNSKQATQEISKVDNMKNKKINDSSSSSSSIKKIEKGTTKIKKVKKVKKVKKLKKVKNKMPINKHFYYRLFELSNSKKTIKDITPKEVVFTRNLTPEEILNRNKIMPQVSNKSIYNPINKKLKIFLLDGDAVGRDSLICSVLLIRLLNILSKDTFYIIRNISNTSPMSNIFSEMNRDIFLQTLVPIGTPNKADNIIAVELGSMIHEFTCSGQKVDILVVSEDKAVLELYEAPNLLNRTAENIFVSSINKTDFINLTKIGIIPAPFYVVVKVCDLDILQLSLKKINPTAHILIFLQVFHNYMHEVKKVFFNIDDILDTSPENLHSIIDTVNTQISKFDLGSDMSPHCTTSRSYKIPLDLSILLEEQKETRQVEENNLEALLSINSNSFSTSTLENSIIESMKSMNTTNSPVDNNSIEDNTNKKDLNVGDDNSKDNLSLDKVVANNKISANAKNSKNKTNIESIFSENLLKCLLEVEVPNNKLKIGNELQIKDLNSTIERYYKKYEKSLEVKDLTKLEITNKKTSLKNAVTKKIELYNKNIV